MPSYEKEYEDTPELKTYEAVIEHWKTYAQMYKESYYLWRGIAISAIFLQLPFWTCFFIWLLAK
ncbi:hypothetical protein SDC9_137679 [bioreactor metagenome]|uniref:Uncharacterized protein n=1 Tax=bioreactor metagenome TaxID=1076179 RepID=A0A645DN79_9ZZZZ